MFWTAGPALGISLAIFLIIGLTVDTSVDVSPDAAVDALEQAFHISVVNLLPLALLVVFTVTQGPARSWRSWAPRCSPASSRASRNGRP